MRRGPKRRYGGDLADPYLDRGVFSQTPGHLRRGPDGKLLHETKPIRDPYSEAAQLQGVVERARSALATSRADVLELTEIRSYSFEEAGAVLGMSPDNVRQMKHRAGEELGSILEVVMPSSLTLYVSSKKLGYAKKTPKRRQH
jgi:DNA-directed RNA polymerase specialized sigma24 family protein